MIILKIKTPGYTISIPGLPAVRSPVELDISKIDVRVVTMYLKFSGIDKYEIVAETKKQKGVYTKKDFEVKETKESTDKDYEWEKRFDRLESILERVVTTSRYETQYIEQNTNKTKIKSNDPDIEELDSFIPDVDVSQMTLSSSDNIKKVKQDKGIEDSADILAGLLKK